MVRCSGWSINRQGFTRECDACLQGEIAFASGPLLPGRALVVPTPVMCGRGGTGRRAALRSLWELNPVEVRVFSTAPFLEAASILRLSWASFRTVDQADGTAPPQIMYSASVIVSAWSDANKAIRLATCAGFDGRPIGTPPRIRVSIQPGAAHTAESHAIF